MSYPWTSKILCIKKEKSKFLRRTEPVQQRPHVSIPSFGVEKQAKSATATGIPAKVFEEGSASDVMSGQRLSVASFVTNPYASSDDEPELGSFIVSNKCGEPVQLSELQELGFDKPNEVLPELIAHGNTPLWPPRAMIAQLPVSSTTQKPTKSYLPLQDQLRETLPTRSGYSTRELSGSTLQDLNDEAQRNNSPPFHFNLNTHRLDTKFVQPTALLYAMPMLDKDPKVADLRDIYDMANLPENRNPFATCPRSDQNGYISAKPSISIRQLSSAGNKTCDMTKSSASGSQLKVMHTQGSNDPNITPPLSPRIAKPHKQQPVIPTPKSYRNFSWPFMNLPSRPHQSSIHCPPQQSGRHNKRSSFARPPTGTGRMYYGDVQSHNAGRQMTSLRSRTNVSPSVPKRIGGSQHQHAYISELYTTLKRTRINAESSEAVGRTVNGAPLDSVPGVQPQTMPRQDDTGSTVQSAQGRAYTEHCVETARQIVQNSSESPEYHAGVGEYPSAKQPDSTCPTGRSFVKALAKGDGRSTGNMMASNASQPSVHVKGKQDPFESAEEHVYYQDSRSWRDV